MKTNYISFFASFLLNLNFVLLFRPKKILSFVEKAENFPKCGKNEEIFFALG